jgi:hypothetical protein
MVPPIFFAVPGLLASWAMEFAGLVRVGVSAQYILRSRRFAATDRLRETGGISRRVERQVGMMHPTKTTF